MVLIAAVVTACGGAAGTTTQTTQAPLVRPACLLQATSADYAACLAAYRDQIDAFVDVGAECAGRCADHRRLADDAVQARRIQERLAAFQHDLATGNLSDVALSHRVDEIMRLKPWLHPGLPAVADLRTLRVASDAVNGPAMRAALRALVALF